MSKNAYENDLKRDNKNYSEKDKLCIMSIIKSLVYLIYKSIVNVDFMSLYTSWHITDMTYSRVDMIVAHKFDKAVCAI